MGCGGAASSTGPGVARRHVRQREKPTCPTTRATAGEAELARGPIEAEDGGALPDHLEDDGAILAADVGGAAVRVKVGP